MIARSRPALAVPAVLLALVAAIHLLFCASGAQPHRPAASHAQEHHHGHEHSASCENPTTPPTPDLPTTASGALAMSVVPARRELAAPSSSEAAEGPPVLALVCVSRT
ncbi:hypothetical protein [Nonomuraea sediminis]|uniref:hypothetical protein n=1 Tax=Nonomuraea sediminis TaxID=2835864 RepID=UPI001BDDA0D6|nr:hypothetical protein [Nonomuraea sediminis]